MPKRVSILILREMQWLIEEARLDDGERYAILKGKVGTHLVTLVTVYGPNMGQDHFAKKLLKEVASFTEGTLILGANRN